MALSAPILPQLLNGIITLAQVINDNGVVVEIPAYPDVSVGDTLKLYWNNIIISSFVVESPGDLPHLLLVPAGSAPLGAYTIFYTVTDMAGNESPSPILSLTIAIAPQAPVTRLLSTVVTNNALANGSQQNAILYTLVGLFDVPMPGRYLLFSSSPIAGVQLSSPYGVTDAAGSFTLKISSTLAGNILIETIPDVPLPPMNNFTSITFTQGPPNFLISGEVLSNNAEADGISQNSVRVKLVDAGTGQPLAGQALAVSASGPAIYPGSVVTNANGEAFISVSSNVVGPLMVTVSVQANPAISTTATVNFTVDYPVLLGTNTAYLQGNIGLQTFLGPHNIQVNQHYRIVISRPYTSVGNCAADFAFTVSTASCSPNYGRNYTFLGDDLTDIVAIASGPGANLTSERYQYYALSAAGVAEIQVFDYGPYYTAFGTV